MSSLSENSGSFGAAEDHGVGVLGLLVSCPTIACLYL